ncbi:hypothetical protein ASG43_08505 [Aureimonas sp. Leaf454]|uniref:nuclear transport factor 2 family protein n=1 Tax=Aureimonas sp. Leaf454 TaxID=1736381 RepID=UPI0006F6792D|nr:nuclear transport factor 2 family protein [Aureimonas sp. Leaf454]KQT48873.1 hypothetical protein ASG43_08505 [Aureimonas sp. Leaf454]
MFSLPDAIALYFTLPADADIADLARAFDEDAAVQDEKRAHRGLRSIRDWRIDTMARTPFTAQPLSVEDRGDRIVVPATVTGAFPGSPVVLDHCFTLRGGRIAALEIA